MQKFYALPTNDNHLIHGTLDGTAKTDKLLIFAHGLTGNQYEHQYYNAPAFFNPKGYDTFRFDFYSLLKQGRQISEHSVAIHVQDLETVINHFQNDYKKLYLIGHSFGCFVIMNSDTSGIQRIIYWDPTKGMQNLQEKNATYDEHSKLYTLHWGLEIQLSQQMIDDWKKAADIESLTSKLTPNSYFIFAGNSNLRIAWQPFLENFPVETIPGATHRFVEEGTLEKLYQQTLKFLET